MNNKLKIIIVLVIFLTVTIYGLIDFYTNTGNREINFGNVSIDYLKNQYLAERIRDTDIDLNNLGGREPVKIPGNFENIEENISNKIESNREVPAANNREEQEEQIETETGTVKSRIHIDINERREDEDIIDNSEEKVSSSETGKSEGINISSRRQQVAITERISEHRVKNGESLWTIARKYGIDIDTIIGANDITNINRIEVGDTLKILPVEGILYRINPGESIWSIAAKFTIEMEAIIELNDIKNPEFVEPGKLLLLPGAKPEIGYRERLNNDLVMPVNARISSYFGKRWGSFHEGIDFAVNTGTRIRAAGAGKVIYSGWARGYGLTVIIEHQKGLRTLYGHNSKLLVHSGQYVNRGQNLCLSGNTGNSTGPHLHFEVQINGKPVNPLTYIK